MNALEKDIFALIPSDLRRYATVARSFTTIGKRTGSSRIGKNHFLTDSTGTSALSMEDYAIALIAIKLSQIRHTRNTIKCYCVVRPQICNIGR